MIPDAEREQAVKERLSGLFGDAPAPDMLRLAAGLDVARSRRRRRKQGRRAIAWLAVACLCAAGTATALWFAESESEESSSAGSVRADGRNEAVAEEQSGGSVSESSDPGDGNSGSSEGPVIYRRAN